MDGDPRNSTTTRYLDLVRRNLTENQEVYVEAHGIEKNSGAVRYILEVEKTRLKRVTLGGFSPTIRDILQASRSQCEEVEALELKSHYTDGSAENGVLTIMARVFPHIRKLRLEMWRLPSASHVVHLANITDLALKNLSPFTADDMRNFFNVLKRAKHLTSFTLVSMECGSNPNLSGDVVWSTEVELHSLKRFEVKVEHTGLLLALLGPLRFHGEMERVVVATYDDRRSELNGRVMSAMTMAFSHLSAPETMKMAMETYTDSNEEMVELLSCQAGWVDRRDHHFLPSHSSIQIPGF